MGGVRLGGRRGGGEVIGEGGGLVGGGGDGVVGFNSVVDSFWILVLGVAFLVVMWKATIEGIRMIGIHVWNRDGHFTSYLLTTSRDDRSSMLLLQCCCSFNYLEEMHVDQRATSISELDCLGLWI